MSALGYKCVRLNRENSIPLLWLNVNVRNENHRGFCRACGAVCVREIRTNYTERVWKFRVKWTYSGTSVLIVLNRNILLGCN